jgi:hypothetical protein
MLFSNLLVFSRNRENKIDNMKILMKKIFLEESNIKLNMILKILANYFLELERLFNLFCKTR